MQCTHTSWLMEVVLVQHMQSSSQITNNNNNTQHSDFYRPAALPATLPTVTKHWRQHCLCNK